MTQEIKVGSPLVGNSSLKANGPTATAKHPMLICQALGGFLLFDVLRLGRNFAKLHRLVGRQQIGARTLTEDGIAAVSRAVNLACIWYPKRVMCLQRSAVTTCLLRSYGVPASMVMGIQSLPFKAHAWTEINGRAINERRNVEAIYRVIDRC